MRRVMSIDPGKNGAIVIIDFDFGNMFPTVEFYDIPLLDVPTTAKTKKGKLKKKTDYDIQAISHVINTPGVERAYLERQQVFPQQGGVSNFSIGAGYYMYRALLTAHNVPFDIFPPREWQKYFGISSKKGDTKVQAYEKACELFPDVADELKTKRGRILDGRCDALLITIYANKRDTKET